MMQGVSVHLLRCGNVTSCAPEPVTFPSHLRVAAPPSLGILQGAQSGLRELFEPTPQFLNFARHLPRLGKDSRATPGAFFRHLTAIVQDGLGCERLDIGLQGCTGWLNSRRAST